MKNNERRQPKSDCSILLERYAKKRYCLLQRLSCKTVKNQSLAITDKVMAALIHILPVFPVKYLMTHASGEDTNKLKSQPMPFRVLN